MTVQLLCARRVAMIAAAALTAAAGAASWGLA
jgi:hypothetical protein